MAQIKNVTELDFDQVKTNLKVFLSSQEKFSDYDFDGAGLNVLLDVLAYNTQYNALLAHMTMNESYLDSAQIRSNVVSHAKNLGYVPMSNRASQAHMKITVTGDNDSPAQLQIPKGTTFTGQIGSNAYTFVTNTSFLVDKQSLNNQYKFSNVIAYEGKLVNLVYRVDNKEDFQKFKIADPNIDTSTILVRVRSSLTSSDYVTYTHYENLLDVKADSKVYYLQENGSGQYEFYFGDGVLGHKPTTGQVAEITYISTNGLDGNGCKSFSINSSIGGYTSILVELSDGFTKTITGSDKESIDSIKFSAPKLYATQNRAVTAEDYRSILLANFDFIEDLTVWGGEQNDPPVYGKVYISIKPNDSETLTDSTKNSISRFLRDKNVGSVTTTLEDPDYTYLNIQALFKYNPNDTARTQSQLESAVYDAIVNYNDTQLEKFDGVFRQSRLLRDIDDVDQGILNTTLRIWMHKHVLPIVGIPSAYRLKFSGPLYISNSNESILETSEFTVSDTVCVATDVPIENSLNRQINIVSASTGNIIQSNVGTIYPSQGLIQINSLQIDSTEEIKIYAKPDSNDIAPKFNQLVRIEVEDTDGLYDGIRVTGEIDTIALLGAGGTSEYTTFPRHT